VIDEIAHQDVDDVGINRDTSHAIATIAIVERLEKGGPVLGIIEWGNYEQGEIRVQEDDLLIMFSDGIIEAMNEAHDQFGEQRLLSVVQKFAAASPAEIQAAVLRAVRDHAGDNHPDYDDQTLVIAKFRNVFATVVPGNIQEIAA